ncbi:MAG: SdiA-regulated domain-containing protein [Cyclobacteriaceae bacterium]|nr:SdiA-regulated domain-containing protein [Cyclobacteriaceae bacterium]
MLHITYILIFSTLLALSNEANNIIPFNIAKPELKIELSKELKEISGLTWYNNNQLGAVQDEAGIFYILNAKTGKIEEKIKFSLPGDFEGVETVGNCIYALTSSGNLFYFDKNTPNKVKKINTPLTWKNNVEGLGYDPLNKRLLIISKDNGSISDYNFKGKSIFTLNVENHTFSTEPLITIKKSNLKSFFTVEKFKPSALAIDPLTYNIYILASVGKLLIVLNKNLKIINVVSLPEKIYAQPEGICFSPKGDLYISNEGKNDRANVYHLARKR